MLAHRYIIFLFSLDVEIDDSPVGQLTRAQRKNLLFCFPLRSFPTIELHRDPIVVRTKKISSFLNDDLISNEQDSL